MKVREGFGSMTVSIPIESMDWLHSFKRRNRFGTLDVAVNQLIIKAMLLEEMEQAWKVK